LIALLEEVEPKQNGTAATGAKMMAQESGLAPADDRLSISLPG